jgi:hypothetical protein
MALVDRKMAVMERAWRLRRRVLPDTPTMPA